MKLSKVLVYILHARSFLNLCVFTLFYLFYFFMFLKECPHPDENQRRQLSSELGLEPRQSSSGFKIKEPKQRVTMNELTTMPLELKITDSIMRL
ncbi:unnamed protein product [Coffea canephora]|uniref:DH200=94 genomic scaffold, scaffold_216 n=1 Tax=Coffea canephora TaxID=49390 RepID=A0A068VC68_COFCA|nr:unnamed protein product [Coffea canephora]